MRSIRLPRHQTTGHRIVRPADPSLDFYRAASCDEVACEWYAQGFQVGVDEATDLGRRQAAYLRADRSRKATERREGGLTIFSYGPGTRCTTAHQVPIEREPLYVIRAGTSKRTTSPAEWSDSLHTVTERVADLRRRG